jgi:hypothetical protein
MIANTEHQPSNGEEPGVRCAIAMMAPTMKRSLVMKSGLLAGAAMLLLAGSAFAANPGSTTTDPSAAFGQTTPTVPYGTGGYVYPEDGSPSGDIAAQVTEPQQPPPANGPFTYVYLYKSALDLSDSVRCNGR